MLTFTPVTQRDLPACARYYKSCEYQLCEYSALVKLMWRSHLHPSWAEGADCLIVRNFIDGQYCFDYPVPGSDGDEDAALTLIEDDCRERDIPLVLSVVPQDKAERLAARYPYFRFSSPRVWQRLYLRRRGSARLCRTPLLRTAQPHQQVPQALSRRRLPPAREERPATHHAVLP